jgi:pantothenate synthetase
MLQLPNITSLTEVEKLESLGVIIEFTPEEEEMQPDYEEEENQAIADKYNAGNMAAWFCAKVTVTYKELSGTDYLGCCSYNSFKEFTTTDKDYYMDMINQCINEVNRQVESINFGTQRHWNIRKAKNLLRPYGLHIVSSNVLQTV